MPAGAKIGTSTSPLTNQRVAEGSTIFPAVHAFLTQFGGLCIHHPNPLAPGDIEVIDLDSAAAVRSR